METITTPTDDKAEPQSILQNGHAASIDSEAITNPQIGGPSLYCPKNGRSHAALLDFDIYECNICKADLKAPKGGKVKSFRKKSLHENDDDDDGSDGSDDDDDDHDNKDDTHDSQDGNAPLSYAIHVLEFQDWDRSLITQQEWQKGPFNLGAAYAAALATSAEVETDKHRVIQAITRLHTNRPFEDIKESHKKNLLAHQRYQWSEEGTDLHIYSDVIISALKAVALYPIPLAVGEPCRLKEPYFIIGHHLFALKEYASRSSMRKDVDDTSKTENKLIESRAEDLEHFNILFDWLRGTQYEAKLISENERIARGFCTFQMLWTILRPSTTVYMSTQGIFSAYVIDDVRFVELGNPNRGEEFAILSTTSMDELCYDVKLWNLKYDGRFVGRKMTNVFIPFFAGEKEISSLIVIPIDLYKEGKPGATRTKLERLGQSWYESLRGQQIYYKGRSVEKPEKQIEGRAYIDPFSKEYNGVDNDDNSSVIEVGCPCDQCHGTRQHPAPDFPWKDYDVIDPKNMDSLESPGNPYGSRHRYLVCDHKVWAVMMKTKNWELLNIAHCSEPKFNDNALEKLVMPKDRKNLIKALVKKFKSTETHDISWRADFVEGKGEGTIFLLHGSPGVGKTFYMLTEPECIAEYTRRPLISLTCADIGTDEVLIEEKLEMWLNRAERWGAVLLIDEADIFLERRQVTDLKRNSLVSVFLRCLEYYRGILFLTTNRVGHFDDAFISRIHIVIKYEALGEAERKQIWSQFFEKLDDERPDFEISSGATNYVLENEPHALHKQPWNGREIRNVFQTAVALAEYRAQTERGNTAPRLKAIDFEQVCNMTKDFKKYLQGISGLNEEQRAFNLGARVGTQEF